MPDEKKEPKKAEKKVEVGDLEAKDVKRAKGGISDQPVRSVEEAEKLAWSILNQRAGN